LIMNCVHLVGPCPGGPNVARWDQHARAFRRDLICFTSFAAASFPICA
jgi:hypothetical protein